MSYDSDPSLYTFEPPPNNCILCHDLDKSPAQVQVAFAGIERGALWVPTDPPPPNGVFEILATAPCSWAATIGLYTIDLHMAPLLSLLEITIAGPITIFSKLWTFKCNLWYPNTITVPAGNKYYGGWGSLSYPQVGATDSIADFMTSINFPPAPGTAVSPRPLTAVETVYVFSRTLDASNLHVKYIHS